VIVLYAARIALKVDFFEIGPSHKEGLSIYARQRSSLQCPTLAPPEELENIPHQPSFLQTDVLSFPLFSSFPLSPPSSPNTLDYLPGKCYLYSMEDSTGIVASGNSNPYDSLVPEAVKEIRHTLHFSDDAKLRLKASEDIIALSSFGKNQVTTPTIVISNSNVQLLAQVAKEIE
jgi:hypothetical protein